MTRPILLPLLESAARRSLVRAGVASRMLPTPLGRVHVYDAPGRGALPTIVLLHGISATAAGFAPMFGALRRQARRVIAIDLPGHGFSDRTPTPLSPEALFEGVIGLLDELDLGPTPIVVGNSLGGAIAVRSAIARPLGAVVLLSPAGAPSSPDEWSALQRAFRIESRAQAVAFLTRVQHRPRLLTHVIAHELVGTARRPAVRDLLETTTPEHVIAGPDLAALANPILLWWGKSERLLPPAHLAWWRAELPAHAVIEEPEGIGHCPHLDDPVRTAARIVAFAERSFRS